MWSVADRSPATIVDGLGQVCFGTVRHLRVCTATSNNSVKFVDNEEG